MGILRKLLLVAGAAIVAFAAYVAMMPPQFMVARSTTISAPPDKIFPHVNDFRKWQAWSPWAKLDPNAKVAFEGAEAGKGAVMKWSGNDEVGEGSMTIADSKPSQSVGMKLDFTRPFPSTADVNFELKPAAAGTEVVWSMSSQQGFFERAMCLLFNGGAMIERDYDKGLANLKSVVEAGG